MNIDVFTSDLVSKLISLGFIPFAKTNTPELGLSYVTESILHGPCRNPYDLNRTCGDLQVVQLLRFQQVSLP